jgi:hypothetical protein
VPDAHAITDPGSRFFHLSYAALFAFFYEVGLVFGEDNKYKIQSSTDKRKFETISQTDEQSRWLIFDHFLDMGHKTLNLRQNHY